MDILKIIDQINVQKEQAKTVIDSIENDLERLKQVLLSQDELLHDLLTGLNEKMIFIRDEMINLADAHKAVNDGLLPTTITYLSMNRPPWYMGSRGMIAEYIPVMRTINVRGGEVITIRALHGENLGHMSRHFYNRVGRRHFWYERNVLSDEEMDSLYRTNDRILFEFYNKSIGKIIGFGELTFENSITDLSYFGLFPEYTGCGYGKPILRKMIEIAWARPTTQKLTVNTNNHDHGRALSVYLNCGFSELSTVNTYLMNPEVVWPEHFHVLSKDYNPNYYPWPKTELYFELAKRINELKP